MEPVNTFSNSSAHLSKSEAEPIEEIFGGPRDSADATLAQWEDITFAETEVCIPLLLLPAAQPSIQLEDHT